MSFLSDLFKGGTAGVFEGAGAFAKNIREAITGESIIDPNKRAELLGQAAALQAAAEQARLSYDLEMSKAQTAINAIEAASSNLFVSGWRPAVGWVCVGGLFYTFLIKPLLPWTVGVIAALFGSHAAVSAMPEVPMGDLVILLAGMLGLTVARSIDKYNGVTGPPNNKG